MAIAETAARKILHGSGRGAVARGVAAGTLSFGLDDLWQLIAGFFADIFAYLFGALAGAAHLLVLPLEALWYLLVAAVAGAAGAISSGLGGLWHLVAGFFPRLFATLAGAAHHLLVLPLEALWQWLVAAVAGVAGAISSGLGGLWHLVAGFFPRLFATLAGAAHHLLVLPLEALWQWLVAAVAGAAGAISSGLGGLWQLVASFFPHLFAAVAGAAHDFTLKLDAFWRWLQAAATVALPFVLGIAAVLLVVALIFFYGPVICAITVGVCKAIVVAVCYFGHGLFSVGTAAASALSCLLPPCAQCLRCCAVVTMKAPGAAGMLISRAAFEAAPVLYFQILRAGGAVVAAAVFCARPVAWAVAAPIAFLFRTSVGA